MSSNEIQELVTSWYSQDYVFDLNANTYPKSPNYIDCKLLDIPSMVTDKMVLNLGCCYPSDEMQFSDTAKVWVAMDISPRIIERCKQLVKKENVIFTVGDMTNIEYNDGQFDTVIDFSSGDHLTGENYKIALKEIYRVLKNKGNFILTYANLDSFPEKEYFGDFGYFRATSRDEMLEWVRSVGFEVVKEINDGDRIGVLLTK